jgi:hypothetical protein
MYFFQPGCPSNHPRNGTIQHTSFGFGHSLAVHSHGSGRAESRTFSRHRKRNSTFRVRRTEADSCCASRVSCVLINEGLHGPQCGLRTQKCCRFSPSASTRAFLQRRLCCQRTFNVRYNACHAVDRPLFSFPACSVEEPLRVGFDLLYL